MNTSTVPTTPRPLPAVVLKLWTFASGFVQSWNNRLGPSIFWVISAVVITAIGRWVGPANALMTFLALTTTSFFVVPGADAWIKARFTDNARLPVTVGVIAGSLAFFIIMGFFNDNGFQIPAIYAAFVTFISATPALQLMGNSHEEAGDLRNFVGAAVGLIACCLFLYNFLCVIKYHLAVTGL